MLHFNLVPHHQTSSNPGISCTCKSSLKAHWRAGITAALQSGVAEIRLCSLEFISLMDGAPHNWGRWCFCSGLPSVHSISVGADSSLRCTIGCNSKPLSTRAAGFGGDAQPERGVGLALGLAAPLGAQSAAQPGVLRGCCECCLCVLLGRASGTLPSWQLQMWPFFCLTLLAGYCNKSGRFSSFEKV